VFRAGLHYAFEGVDPENGKPPFSGPFSAENCGGRFSEKASDEIRITPLFG
jgi:hypothetical protein